MDQALFPSSRFHLCHDYEIITWQRTGVWFMDYAPSKPKLREKVTFSKFLYETLSLV